MKVEDGYIKVHIDDLLQDEEILKACAKHATFDRYLIDGLVKVMLTDEAAWEEDESPWYTVISFGRSYFEEARMKILKSVDEMAHTQVERFQKERDTYSRLYDGYQTKCIHMEQTVSELKNQIRILKLEREGEL